MSVKNKDEILKQLAEEGMENLVTDVESLMRNSINIKLTAYENDSFPVGSSKIGGLPDLPSKTKWPKEESGELLSFMAQLNLSELSKYDTDKELPNSGMLYFFYSTANQPWGYDPLSKSCWKVIYYKGEYNELKRKELSEKDSPNTILSPSKMEFRSEVTLPSFDSIYMDKLNLDKRTQKKLSDFIYKIIPEEERYSITHRLLGYPDLAEGDMKLGCQLASNGINVEKITTMNTPEIRNLQGGVKDWRLLLQIDSDDTDARMTWADFGRIYFWIRDEDLANKNFDNVWVILND